MLTIITPCSTTLYLNRIKDSIQWDIVSAWYICYENETPQQFSESSIKEATCTVQDVISRIPNGFVYLLPDDTTIHPEFWKIVPTLDDMFFYTWCQQRSSSNLLLPGAEINDKMDTSQWLAPRSLLTTTSIRELYETYPDYHIYIHTVACFYHNCKW
jgi:hypothetical protein